MWYSYSFAFEKRKNDHFHFFALLRTSIRSIHPPFVRKTYVCKYLVQHVRKYVYRMRRLHNRSIEYVLYSVRSDTLRVVVDTWAHGLGMPSHE